jgi:hypothetical protein
LPLGRIRYRLSAVSYQHCLLSAPKLKAVCAESRKPKAESFPEFAATQVISGEFRD